MSIKILLLRSNEEIITEAQEIDDPETKEPNSNISYFDDSFIPLTTNGPWVLSRRTINTNSNENNPSGKIIFTFNSMSLL